MKNARYMVFTAIAAALVLSVTARATDPVDCNAQTSTKFTGATDNDWTDSTNWNRGVPTQYKDACIPAGETAQIIFDTTPEVRDLWVEGTVELWGNYVQSKWAWLTLYGDCTIDGDVLLTSGPKLKIANNITIDGTGTLGLRAETDWVYPEIVGTNEFKHLTLNGANAGSWTPEEWDDQDDTLVVWGAGNINVIVTNNAHITTRNETLFSVNDATLTIAKTAYGDGFWIAERNDQLTYDKGILDVTESVSGAATWVVTGDDDADLRFNAACTNLTGDVLVYDGRVLVNQNFETAGNLTFEDAGSDPTEILVGEGKTAKFSVP